MFVALPSVFPRITVFVALCVLLAGVFNTKIFHVLAFLPL